MAASRNASGVMMLALTLVDVVVISPAAFVLGVFAGLLLAKRLGI